MNKKQPNVILILTDDQGWDDLSLHGNPHLKTPVLDSFATSAVQFDNYYVAAVCSASRASLLTGRHFLRTGVAHVHGGKDFVHPDEIMMAELFQTAGYRTGMWGKWHSGKSTGYFPWERGFDEAYMAQLYVHKNNYGHLNGEFKQHEGWAVDTFVDYALDFMDQESDQPFFAYLPFMTVHSPLDAPEEMIQSYMDKGLSRNLSLIYAMLEQMDSSIGRLLDGLKKRELEEDTIILFMSDNGPAILDDLLTEEDRKIRYVNQYKGHKGNMWENGIKSPLFIKWGEKYQAHNVTRLADICDILPTLADLCDIEIPTTHPTLDGRSIAPYLEGDETSLPDKESYIYVNPGWPPSLERPYRVEGYFDEYGPVDSKRKKELDGAEQLISIRTENWKLLQNPGVVNDMPDPVNGKVLVDISQDPKENNNVILREKETVEELDIKLKKWFDEIKAEPHSYHIPVFEIGPDTTNFVGAYAPITVSGNVINGGVATLGWAKAGDAADYQIHVTQDGNYEVTLDYQKASKEPVTLILKTKSSQLVFSLDQEPNQYIGTIDLEEGEQLMRMELIESTSQKEAPIDRIFRFSFKMNQKADHRG